jgi:integrase
MSTGIESRTDAKGRKRYRGVVFSKATGKRNGPWVRSFAEARSWRTRALAGIESGLIGLRDGTTLRDEWQTFYAGACAGTIPDRTGKPYKPATLRGYERGWRRIDPEFGASRPSELRRADVQAMIDRWAASGLAPSTIRNSLDPLRALYRRAVARDRVAINPMTNLEVPRADNARERFATREEAAMLLGALPVNERALWASAMYAGLRRGELRALRWDDVDLDARLINVRRSWDDREGESEPKTKGSKRRVPIVPALAELLHEHQSTTARRGHDLAFGRTPTEPFKASTIRRRALTAWEAASLKPITLHECRHTAASLMIAAGCNAKALSVVMGHASIEITFNRYGKLMPGGETEVGRLLAEYLVEGSEPTSRIHELATRAS